MARLRELLTTWHGRLFLVNLALFAYVSWRSQSLFMPDTETLIAVGAKDPVRLAAGEWWRLVTPIFIHVGLLHFALNSYMLNVVGRQLEEVLGGPWFILIYLVSGIAGNVASSVFSPNLSAGASGAIFGLLGAGLFIEQSIGARVRAATGQKPPRGAFFMTVVLNLGFGFVLPFIDNTAHLGGLFAGFALALAMARLRANKLVARRPAQGYMAIMTLSALLGVGGYIGTSKPWILRQMGRAAAKADGPRDGIFYLSQGLSIDPAAYELGLERARLLFQINEPSYALYDVREALADGRAVTGAQKLADDLMASGKMNEAAEVRQLIDRR